VDTRPDDLLEAKKWTSLSQLGLPVGKATSIQNVARGNGLARIRVWIGLVPPAVDFVGGRRLVTDALANIKAGENEIHLYAEDTATHVNIEITP
jgi:hypothetical protein